jgi:hypothetical protein
MVVPSQRYLAALHTKNKKAEDRPIIFIDMQLMKHAGWFSGMMHGSWSMIMELGEKFHPEYKRMIYDYD